MSDLASALAYAGRGPSAPRWSHIVTCAESLGPAELAQLDAALAQWPDDARIAPEAWAVSGRSQIGIARRIELRGVALDRAIAETIATCEHARRVSSIALFAAGTRLDGVAVLAHSALPALAELQIGCFDGLDDAAAILANAPLGIRVLTFEGSGASDAALRHLASGSGLPSLRHLQAHDARITDDGAGTVAGAPRLAPLTFLRLSYCDLGDDGAIALARSPHVRSLDHLGLQMNHVGPKGARAIAESSALASVRSLYLDANRLGRAGVVALAQSRTLVSLRALTVGHVHAKAGPETERDVGSSGARSLASASYAAQLAHLDVAGNAIGDEGALALLDAMPGLDVLDLAMNGLTDRTTEHLVASGALEHLRTLRFEHNEASEDGLGALIDTCEARGVELTV